MSYITNPAITNELEPDERLLWSGQPQQGLKLRRSDALLIPFSIMWAGFAVFWEVGVITSDAPIFFILWGIPFLLMGLYITIGRFFIDAAGRRKTRYGITNKRILFVGGLFSYNVVSIRWYQITGVVASRGRNGNGAITFKSAVPFARMRRSLSLPNTNLFGEPTFEFLDDVRSVEQVIAMAQEQFQRESR